VKRVPLPPGDLAAFPPERNLLPTATHPVFAGDGRMLLVPEDARREVKPVGGEDRIDEVSPPVNTTLVVGIGWLPL